MLIIKDDGCGLAKDIDFDNPNSIRVMLFNVLNKQLKAKLEVNSSQGATFCLTSTKEETKGSASNYLLDYLLQNKKL